MNQNRSINITSVATILINFNNWQDTICCIESIYAMSTMPQWIIILDNSTCADDYQHLTNWVNEEKPSSNFTNHHDTIFTPTARHPDISLILLKSKSNNGFAAGCNQAIRHILSTHAPSYIWLLNNDTIVKSDTLEALLKNAVTSPDVGIIGSALYNMPPDSKVQGLAGYYHPWFSRPQHILESSEIDKLNYIIGASFLITNKCWKECGEISEEYFLYFEETDYCTHAIRKGFKLAAALDSIVYHSDGASSNRTIKEYFYTRNLLIYTWKWHPQKILFSFSFILFTRLLGRIFKSHIPKKPIFIGIFDFVTGVRGAGSMHRLIKNDSFIRLILNTK
jgi:GT2 family glycosyltransferase